jgi:hypothetical protein
VRLRIGFDPFGKRAGRSLRVRRYARPGTIPELGEIWRPVCPNGLLMSLHLVEIAAARRFLPPGLRPIPVWPGKTLGGVLLGYYGPGSTLEYHELAVLTGLARFRGRFGFWVSHLYVDSEASVIGGQHLGLDKQIADFDWPAGMPPFRVTVVHKGQHLLGVRGSRGFPLLPFWLGAGSFSRLGGRTLWFSSRFRAWWRICRVEYTVPENSPLADLRLGRPLVAVAAKRARGLMVERIGK